MAHILPDPPRTWDYPMASPPPLCPHGVPYAQRCNGCGWVCPTCKRSYAPWVRECNYRHDEAPAALACVTPILAAGSREPIAVNLRFPGEWASPHYQRIVRVGRTWKEALPGIQCYVQNPVPAEDGSVTLCLRLAPLGAADDPGPIETG